MAGQIPRRLLEKKLEAESERTLTLSFSGRIIDHLGIQMYLSPVAAIAELVANAWDADAENVWITLPDSQTGSYEYIIKDDGLGMSFEECKQRYLKVGWCRRGSNPVAHTPEKGRPVLGRKGIGKFAGFGIAEIIRVETTSEQTGEKTVFELNINDLRSEEYIVSQRKISVEEYLGPDEARKADHGTVVTLTAGKFRRPSPEQFAKSMARRFLLHQQVADFKIFANGNPIPDYEIGMDIEFSFPEDYKEDEKPEGLVVTDGWGQEEISEGKVIQWRISFLKDPIDEEDLRGVSIFSHGKMAQSPFFFNISKAPSGQHGQQYMFGQVQADYVDELEADIIATERQRINWNEPESIPLLEWGQETVKQLLRIWRDRRGEKRKRALEEKVKGFSTRLGKLRKHESATIKKALVKLGGIETLSQEQFEDLGNAILTALEHGRLRDLIDDISESDDLTTDEFLNLLMEAQVLEALNAAEVIRTKIDTIRGLERRIEKRELENKLRDYIAENPWLLDPKWETFKREIAVKHILDGAAKKAGLSKIEYKGRVDLALRSGEHLLVVEFMKPHKALDYDHLARCKRYVQIIRTSVRTETALNLSRVAGLIVADKLERSPEMAEEIKSLRKDDIYTFSWDSLLEKARETWREFLDILIERAPDDERIQALKIANGG